MINVGAFMGFKGVFGRGKNGFWRFEGLKMVKYVNLPRVLSDVVAGATVSMAGATRVIAAGPSFDSFCMGFSMLFMVWGSG